MATFHEAENIRAENVFEETSEHRWVATHRRCGGRLELKADAWSCEDCKASFRDAHCEDLIHAREDETARNKAANDTAIADPKDGRTERGLTPKAESRLLKSREQYDKTHRKAKEEHGKRAAAEAKRVVRDILTEFGNAWNAGQIAVTHRSAADRLPLAAHAEVLPALGEAADNAIAVLDQARASKVQAMIAAGEPEPTVQPIEEIFATGRFTEEEAALVVDGEKALREEYRRQKAAEDARNAAAAAGIDAGAAGSVVLPVEDPRTVEQLREFVKYLLDNDKPEPNVPSIVEVTAAGNDIAAAELIVAEQTRFRDEYRRQKAQREADEAAKKPGSL